MTETQHLKIALAVIAGDDCIEDGIQKMIETAAPQVDGIYISFNGEDQAVFDWLTAFVPEHTEHGEVSQVPWQDDFSLARNHSFHLVPKDDYDWIIWLDCDDVLVDVDLQAVAAEASKRRVHQVFMPYDYQSDEHGLLYTHLKERMFRADARWTWVYPVHENCVGSLGSRRFIDTEHGPITHRRGSAKSKRDRNRRIIAKWYKSDTTNLRAIQMMAHQLYVEVDEMDVDNPARVEMAQECMTLYRDFIDRRDPDDESYVANIHYGRLLRIVGRVQDAINIFLQGIKLRPTWPSAYCEVAETYLGIGWNDHAIEWATVCDDATVTPTDTFAPTEPLDESYRPLMIIGAAQINKKDYAAALKAFQQAHLHRADDFTKGKVREAAELLEHKKDEDSRSVGDKTREDYFDTFKYARVGEHTIRRSICFVTRQHFETWDTNKLETEGLSGTETCVIRLAQQLAAQNWRVVIFGTPETEGVDADGIEWYETRRWHPDEHFTATVAVRMPELFDADIANTDIKILWMHDVNVGDVRLSDDDEDRFARCDVIVCPSFWHAEHLIKVYNLGQGEDVAEVQVMMNGFDVAKFQQSPTDTEARVLNRFVYASSPDRGLERLLELWPAIQQRHPAAALEIFYGFEGIDKIIEQGHDQGAALAAFKAKIEAMIDKLDGVTMHGRVNEETLARYLKTSGVMAYPADFLDTFGIVFNQALVAGCIPVMPRIGALGRMMPEALTVPGAPNSDIFGEMFLDRVDQVLGHLLTAEGLREYEGLWELHRSNLQSCEWPVVAEAWAYMIGRRVEEKQNPVKIINAGALQS